MKKALLALSLLFSFCVCINLSKGKYVKVDELLIPNYATEKDVAREQCIRLLKHFSSDEVPKASDYPAWYGGC